MADILLRNVPPKTLDALRERARIRKRSMEAEALDVLERGVATTIDSEKVDFEPAVRFIREMRDER